MVKDFRLTLDVNRKVIGVHYLRGIAALAVVFCHYGQALTFYPVIARTLSYGQLGVHVFFLISGFVIILSLIKNQYRLKDFFMFLLKRSVRIDPPYIVTILLTLLTFFVLSQFSSFNGKPIPLNIGQFVAHICYIIPFTKWDFYNDVYWTLCIEFQFYILIGTIYFITEKKIFRLFFLILFGLSCLLHFENSYYILFNYAPLFAMGMSFLHYLVSRDKSFLIPLMLNLVLTAVHFDLLTATLLTASLVSILYFQSQIKVLEFLGTISYSLYITHTLLFVVLNGLLKKIIPTEKAFEIPILIFEVCTAILVGYTFYAMVEKPAMRLSKNIFYKKNG